MLPYFHELVSLFFRGKTTQFVPIYPDHPDYVEQFDQADQADHPDQMTALINHKRRSSAMNIAPDIIILGLKIFLDQRSSRKID